MGVGNVELEVEAVAAGGRGVARHAGMVWFVAGALPGDRVLARVTRRHPRFVEARATAIASPSPERREPACALQSTCGGCPWMPLPEAVQRRWKRRLVVDALIRIGGLTDPPVEEVRHPSAPLGYRNRVELSVGRGAGGEPTIGMHAAEPTAGLVDVAGCPVQQDEANHVLASVRAFLLAEPRAAALAATTPGVVHRMLLRRSAATGRILVGLWETPGRPFPHADELARYLRERLTGLAGVVRLRARPGQRGGTRVEPLTGAAKLVERIAGFEFELDATTFTQVNAAGAEELVRLVADCAGDVSGASIVDLFGGVGAYGLTLARGGAAPVTVCDADRQAIVAGRRAARSAGLRGIRFVHDQVARFLDREREIRAAADVVVANPPRAGLGRGCAAGIAAYRPRRVVLVSCDSATLARDVKTLGAHGLRVRRVVPVDLFPQTAHVEAVALLQRES